MFASAKVVITAGAMLQTRIGTVDLHVAPAAHLAYTLDAGRVGLSIGSQSLPAMFLPAPFLSAVATPSLQAGPESQGHERYKTEDQQQHSQEEQVFAQRFLINLQEHCFFRRGAPRLGLSKAEVSCSRPFSDSRSPVNSHLLRPLYHTVVCGW